MGKKHKKKQEEILFVFRQVVGCPTKAESEWFMEGYKQPAISYTTDFFSRPYLVNNTKITL